MPLKSSGKSLTLTSSSSSPSHRMIKRQSNFREQTNKQPSNTQKKRQ
uniref:Ovule protein n=1 Tax=Schistosoma mansoni TaxID=6183 RepID=A0A5K4F6W0_SCHMA